MIIRRPQSTVRVLTFAAAVLLSAAVAPAQRQLAMLDVPLAPGQRDVTHLFTGSDGQLYGVAMLDGGTGRLIAVNVEEGSVARVNRLPDPMVPPQPLLDGRARAWAWSGDWRTGYWLNNDGELIVTRGGAPDETVGRIAGTRPFETGDPQSEGGAGLQISGALMVARSGNVYTAGDGGHLYRYAPGEKTVTKLDVRLPAVPGRHPWAVLDAAVQGDQDEIYGATFDGYLFRFDPVAETVINLGKPIRQQRVQGLVLNAGMVVGYGGEPMGVHRGFGFDPFRGGFDLDYALTPGFHPVRAVAAGPDGNVYVALGGRLGGVARLAAQ